MSAPINFDEQYTRARKTIEQAIANKQTIVLFGGDATGKSYICKELDNKFSEKDYTFYFYEKNDNKNFKYSTPCVVQTDNIECLSHIHRYIQSDELGVVIVNMNYHSHPSFKRKHNTMEHNPIY